MGRVVGLSSPPPHYYVPPPPLLVSYSSDRKPWLEADFELVMPLLFVVVVRWFLEYEAATYVLFDNFLGGKILEEVQTSETAPDHRPWLGDGLSC